MRQDERGREHGHYGRTPFEGWNPMTDRTPRTQTSEAVFEWLAHTKAFAENDWKGVDPWNAPRRLPWGDDARPGAAPK